MAASGSGKEISTNALLTGCEIHKGFKAVERSLAAVMDIYENIRSSYGPLGLDKMCVDASGSVSITNDGSTILRNMLVDDPIGKLLVNLALEQDREVGDGTTTVVLLASNLIKLGAELIIEGVHPSVVVSGYRLAFNESKKYITSEISQKITGRGKMSEAGPVIDSIISTSLASKVISQEWDVFSCIVKCAMENVFRDEKYYVDDIRILKSLGGSIGESKFFNGFLLNCSPTSTLMPTTIDNPKILCLSFSLSNEKLPMNVNIKTSDPEMMEKIRDQEIEITKIRLRAIIDSGANIVLTTGGIDEIYSKGFVDNGIVAVRRCLKEDLAILAKATNAELHTSLISPSDGLYEVTGLGSCVRYERVSIGENALMKFSDCPKNVGVVLLRGPNSQILDEVERSLNDGIQVVKRTLESRSIVPGGGAVEVALSFLLEEFAGRVGSCEYVAIHRYSQALLEIPRLLAANAGLDADTLLANLMKEQYEVFKSDQKGVFKGLDVLAGTIQDNFGADIVEPTVYKLKVLKAATEAAINVLRIEETVIFTENKS